VDYLPFLVAGVAALAILLIFVGLAPAAELKRLERAILDQDPSIAAPSAERSPTGDRPQLPDSSPPPPVPGLAPSQDFRRRRAALLGAVIIASATEGDKEDEAKQKPTGQPAPA